MTEVLHNEVELLNNKHFPLVQRSKKSTDPLWITEQVKRNIRRRKRAFAKKRKRNDRWQSLKSETNDLIKRNKQDFFRSATEKLIAAGSNQLPYHALKELAIPERPAAWSINQLRPNVSDERLAEELSEFFSRITDAFEPVISRRRSRHHSLHSNRMKSLT